MRASHVRILVKVVNTCGVKRRCAPFDAMNRVPFAKKQFGKVRAVLSGDSGDESRLHEILLRLVKVTSWVTATDRQSLLTA